MTFKKNLSDKIPQERLLTKVNARDIQGYAARWILNWLAGRRRRVCINGTYSIWAPVTSCVPQDIVLGPLVYPEWPHRQGGCLACWRLQGYNIECLAVAELHRFIYARSVQGVLPMGLGSATSQLDLPSLTPFFIAGYGRLQLGVPQWATSVDYFKKLIIDPTFCGSRFSTGRLLAIEKLPSLPLLLFMNPPHDVNLCHIVSKNFKICRRF